MANLADLYTFQAMVWMYIDAAMQRYAVLREMRCSSDTNRDYFVGDVICSILSNNACTCRARHSYIVHSQRCNDHIGDHDHYPKVEGGEEQQEQYNRENPRNSNINLCGTYYIVSQTNL
jgi:hypothetical protein